MNDERAMGRSDPGDGVEEGERGRMMMISERR